MARAATRSSGPGNPLLNQYLKCMGEIPLLKRADEVEVARLIALNGADAEIAKQTLINANLRLVVSIAKQYSIVGQTNCGESCIDPDDEDLYKKLEKNLTPAPDGVDDPCYQEGFPVYIETVTHGVGKLAKPVDLYTSNYTWIARVTCVCVSCCCRKIFLYN